MLAEQPFPRRGNGCPRGLSASGRGVVGAHVTGLLQPACFHQLLIDRLADPAQIEPPFSSSAAVFTPTLEKADSTNREKGADGVKANVAPIQPGAIDMMM